MQRMTATKTSSNEYALCKRKKSEGLPRPELQSNDQLYLQKALATAKKVIKEATGGAAGQSYSFLQVDRMHVNSGADLAKFEAVRFVRDLARKSKSPMLAQATSQPYPSAIAIP